jgi:hypothetical protein
VEQRGTGQQPDDVGEVVVAAHLAQLEVVADEAPVQQQARGPARATARGGVVGHSASAATQLAARIATSIVHAQLAPNSTGLRAIQSLSWAPISSR